MTLIATVYIELVAACVKNDDIPFLIERLLLYDKSSEEYSCNTLSSYSFNIFKCILPVSRIARVEHFIYCGTPIMIDSINLNKFDSIKNKKNFNQI